MTESRALPVPDGLDGVRVDQALGRLLGFSRTRAAEIADAGGVRLDGQALGKGDRLRASGMLLVEWEEAPRGGLEVVPQAAPGLVLAYQDDDLVVVDKPIGVAAHPAPGWTGPTVLGALASMGVPVATSGPAERAGIVHRLDAGTSGLMVVAKREQAYTVLKRAFRDRTVQKVYHAIVQGHPDPTVGTIDAPIGRHPKQEFKFAVTTDGKPSVTHYRVLEAFRGASLLEIELETGRTHQIRVHMAAQRHPCAGDTMYGADPTLAARLGLTRQWLHAMRLGFAHPATGEWLETTSDYPDDLRTALERLTD